MRAVRVWRSGGGRSSLAGGELAEKRRDLRPVRLRGRSRAGMARRNGRMQLVRAWAPRPQRLLDNCLAFGDHRLVPQAPVLTLQGHELAVGVGSRLPSGVGEQQQRKQAPNLRFTSQQRAKAAGQPDRLLAQFAADQAVTRSRHVALGEYQVHHAEHYAEELPQRLGVVLRVVYLVFTQGHMAATGDRLIRGELCEQAIRLARGLGTLLRGEPEVRGLLALLLLTDARRKARTDADGELVPLESQDRRLWDKAMIAEGEAIIEQALRSGRPGPYQLHAAIAACHSGAGSAAETDWPQIAALYGELIRYEPTAVVQANRAVAVGMAEGPDAGLAILDSVREHPQLAGWPQLHLARAEMLRRLDRDTEALAAYRTARQLARPSAERTYIDRRIRELTTG